MSVALVLGAAAAMVFAPSFETITIGSFLIGSLGWVWSLILSTRRAARGASLDILATREGLSSSLWSLEWSRVDRIDQVTDPDGRLVELWIEPIRPDDVRWATRVLHWNDRVNHRFGHPSIKIMQKLVDRPLPEILVDLQRLAHPPGT